MNYTNYYDNKFCMYVFLVFIVDVEVFKLPILAAHDSRHFIGWYTMPVTSKKPLYIASGITELNKKAGDIPRIGHGQCKK